MGGTCVPATFHKLPSSRKYFWRRAVFIFKVKEGRLCKHWFVSKAENGDELKNNYKN